MFCRVETGLPRQNLGRMAQSIRVALNPKDYSLAFLGSTFGNSGLSYLPVET